MSCVVYFKKRFCIKVGGADNEIMVFVSEKTGRYSLQRDLSTDVRETKAKSLYCFQ